MRFEGALAMIYWVGQQVRSQTKTSTRVDKIRWRQKKLAKDPDLKFILYCGFHVRLRKSEILGARVFWFDLGAGLLHVQNEPETGFVLKDRENRPVPLNR